jgi:hypothetical protein
MITTIAAKVIPDDSKFTMKTALLTIDDAGVAHTKTWTEVLRHHSIFDTTIETIETDMEKSNSANAAVPHTVHLAEVTERIVVVIEKETDTTVM